MPSTFDYPLDVSKRSKTLKSAYDSETFDADVTIHVDGLVGSATISPSGRDVALASPEGLAIIDLDSPFSPPRRLSTHGLPWLVVDVQWSPFAARDYWVASTANHRCLVWNLSLREDSASGAIEHSLQGHSRAITDVNFSAHHPDILATCAVDGYVHTWDLRKPKQPVLTFCDWFAGATQVKYNRQDPFILASSHDRWLHIWDERNPSVPLKSISAHTSKIYGVDWNRTEATKVATCSLDKSIKIWDYAASDEPASVIKTEFPVWRARHTPFGWGLLAMPQTDPGNLYLYDLGRNANENEIVDPVTVFPGHGNHKVKEFLWRTRGGVADGTDNREFQLVSWGEDNQLRLHKAEPKILQSVGHVKGGEALNIPITRKGAAYKTYRAIDDHSARERRAASMSDPRPGSGGGHYMRSALTLGMQTMSAHTPRPKRVTGWKGHSMKVQPAAAKGNDRHHDQLGWMRGITLNKRKASVISTPQRKDSKDSTMFGPSFHNERWGEPETLQEEILRVNQQLPNVQWDNVDMESLTLRASLKGPWGADGDTIYIKVRVDVPARYPKARAPKFVIEKTALMADKVHKRLDEEVNQLAQQFSKKHQNCLDVAFSYLLGEIDLSSSDTFFKNVRDLDDDFDGIEDDSSSEDEENDIPPGGSAIMTMSQELSASTELDATLGPIYRPTIPPNPRTCGARFSNDGRLVCFFRTKEDKIRTLFTPTDGFRERARDEPTFSGFGRLQQDSTPPRHRTLNDDSMTEDHSDSDASEASSSSSSDSETTYLNKINMWYLPGRRFRKALSGTYSVHSSGGGTGVGTGTGTAASRRRAARPKNVVSIYNLADDLPSKRELASEYSIFGDGPDVCEHNAYVAEKYGRHDLVDVWRYAGLLLRRDIPLELLEHEKQRDTILVIAKDAIARFSGDKPNSGGLLDNNTLTGRVKWGHHPLATGLIRELFEYFEQLGDVQMLAMLSCIFSESTAEDSIAYAESQLAQPETPLPMKAPSFSLDYFPVDASLWHSNQTNLNYKSQANSALSTPKTLHTPLHIVGSYGSDEFWPGEPESTSYSCGDTPPSRTPRGEHPETDPTQSLSTSPENRLLRRANTAFSSGLASIQRPFASAASTSPPTRKRVSPAETFLNNLTPSNITWGGSTTIGPVSEPSMTARNSMSDDEYRREDNSTLVCYGISAQVEDQSIFDDDGWLAVPFLEPSRNSLWTSYRCAYAEMLQMWNLPLARLEVLKFNVLMDNPSTAHSLLFGSAGTEGFYSSYQSNTIDSNNNNNNNNNNITAISQNVQQQQQQQQQQQHYPIAVGKKEQLQALVQSSRGIDIRGICRVHEIHLDPIRSSESHATVGGGVGTCERCKRTQKQMLCVFCREPIDALYPPCLACGCTIHDNCLGEWHEAEESECPAGDECDCVREAMNGQIETIAAMMGALRLGKFKPQREDDGGWENVENNKEISHHHHHHQHHQHQQQQQPLSAARISLGSRLRKSAGTWGSSSTLRRKPPVVVGGTTSPSGLGRQ